LGRQVTGEERGEARERGREDEEERGQRKEVSVGEMPDEVGIPPPNSVQTQAVAHVSCACTHVSTQLLCIVVLPPFLCLFLSLCFLCKSQAGSKQPLDGEIPTALEQLRPQASFNGSVNPFSLPSHLSTLLPVSAQFSQVELECGSAGGKRRKRSREGCILDPPHCGGNNPILEALSQVCD